MIKSGDNVKAVTIEKLRALGYTKTGERFSIGKGDVALYTVFELQNEDGRGSVGFCYACSLSGKLGFVLPESYDHYLARAANGSS